LTLAILLPSAESIIILTESVSLEYLNCVNFEI
jgi:hypothetical protein